MRTCVCLFFLWCVGHLCYEATSGFQLLLVQTPKRRSQYEATLINPPLSPELHALLGNTRFHFLGNGSQCFAFVSDDGRYVLKLIKQHNLYIPPVFGISRQERREQFMQSCMLAWNSWRQESAMLYVHLQPSTGLHTQIHLVDKLHIAHTLDADTTQFILQQRATLVEETLSALQQQGRLEEAQACVRSLISLIQERPLRGLGDRDPVVRRNFGFLGTRAIAIDIGSYYANAFLAQEPLYTRATYFELKALHDWLKDHEPALANLAAVELRQYE